MKYPWEKPFDYVKFMNEHVRVSVIVGENGKEYFSVVDDGTDMNVVTNMPDGRSLVFKAEGHPRTMDRVFTATDLVNYVLTNHKR